MAAVRSTRWAVCRAIRRTCACDRQQRQPRVVLLQGSVGNVAAQHWGNRRFAATAEKEPSYATGKLSGYQVFHCNKPFKLHNGGVLPEMTVAYETWGVLNANKDNAILLHCGMSASSHACSNENNPARGWWEDFIGPGKALDTSIFCVICPNNLGGCFGSTGPSSPHPEDGKPWGSRFPRFDVVDQVRSQFLLLDHLGIERVHACVGASLGGMQSVCAAATFPSRVGKFISISGCAKSFPGSIAFRHAQRHAIMSDPNFNGGDYYDAELPEAGLRLARQIGTITYRSGQEWQDRFGQSKFPGADSLSLKEEFVIERYLVHQGGKWVNNYDPNSMIWISKAQDNFTMEKPDKDGKPSLIAGLEEAMQPALVIGVQHDVLFPVWQQKEIADTLRSAGNKHVVYYELDTVYGHDSFLLDHVAIAPAVKGHLEHEPHGAAHLWKEMAAKAATVLQASLGRSTMADSFRDIFRALAGDKDTVDRDRLKTMLKLVYDDRLSAADVEKVFAERLPATSVSLPEFMAIRDALGSKYETYLP